MIDCTQARACLSALLYDDLGQAESAQVQAHLAKCPSCRQELAALERVRRTLDQAQAPAVVVDLPRLLDQAAQIQAGKLRRWRRLAVGVSALAACLLLAFGLSLEVRWEGHQLVLRWGEPPAVAEPSPVPPVPPAPVAAVPAELAEEIAVTKELLRLLAADLASRDQRQQRELAALQFRVEALQRQTQLRWTATERDVNALYTAYFGPKDKGANP